MKISRVNEMRHLDQRAVSEYGIPEQLLMENAGEAAYFTILNEFGVKDKSFVIFCGSGNNGGDGFVVARKLFSNGARVSVFILGDRKKYKDAARLNLSIAETLGLTLFELQKADSAAEELVNADAVIDALFGTGLTREVTGKYKDVIQLINSSGKPIFSLDIPSGVHGDTGQVMGAAIHAKNTITFGLPKTGNLLYPGFELGGKLFVTHISFPPKLTDSDELLIATNDPIPLPKRNPDSHKSSLGKALFIAGSANYFGAPYFAAYSFLKAGGGLSFLAAPDNITPFIANKGSEVVMLPQKVTASGSIGLQNKAQLLDYSRKVDFVIIGPGLSLDEETQNLVRELTAAINRPLLIDGDGITAVAQNPDCLKNRTAPTILTPHIGEMARIVEEDISEIVTAKIDVLQKATQNLNATIVLKGAHSLIGFPDARVVLNLSGNAGMATAGSGDILTGTIAAMFGMGLQVEEAVRMGVFLHGCAGDFAAQECGEDGMTAGDIMEQLPAVLKTVRQDFDSITANHVGKIHTV
ncbi:MAG: NAD(P)H-hydrate dehydratase [bacterium]